MSYEERKTNRRGPYRSRSGLVMGVCRGLAEHFGFSVKVFRIVTLIGVIVTGFWPGVAIYLVAAYLMKLEPLLPVSTDSEEEFYNSYARDRHLALARIKLQYDRINRRIGRMENSVTNKEYSWEERLNGKLP
ncbi:MAG: PspC domain-containing protein [Deltaproteobacteria bacterium]|nr:PspC domain-containing protein [Deltaproteobacteria bacterium]